MRRGTMKVAAWAVVVVCVSVMGGGERCEGADVRWNPPGSNHDWFLRQNWNDRRLPTIDDHVEVYGYPAEIMIPGAVAGDLYVSGVLNITDTGTLDVATSMTVVSKGVLFVYDNAILTAESVAFNGPVGISRSAIVSTKNASVGGTVAFVGPNSRWTTETLSFSSGGQITISPGAELTVTDTMKASSSLVFQGGIVLVDKLTGIGTINLAGGELRIGISGGSSLLEAHINQSGDGVLVKVGTGDLTLTDQSVYNGPIRVEGGFLSVAPSATAAKSEFAILPQRPLQR